MPATDSMNAVVVGGSRGIGRAMVEALLTDARFGHVVAASRRIDEDVSTALSAAHGARFSTLTLDVTDEASIAAAAEMLATRTPRLHRLIDCAGLLHADDVKPERRLADVQPDALLRSFAVNALGPLLLAKHFHSLLAHDEPAVLANLSARVGSIGDNRLGGWYAYRASKAAQNQITRSLAIELARRAPRLVCVALHPGTVDTDLSKPFQAGVAADRLFTPAQAAAQLLKVIDGLTPADSGRFLAWDGREISW